MPHFRTKGRANRKVYPVGPIGVSRVSRTVVSKPLEASPTLDHLYYWYSSWVPVETAKRVEFFLKRRRLATFDRDGDYVKLTSKGRLFFRDLLGVIKELSK